MIETVPLEARSSDSLHRHQRCPILLKQSATRRTPGKLSALSAQINRRGRRAISHLSTSLALVPLYSPKEIRHLATADPGMIPD
jgi:hypothetical protein